MSVSARNFPPPVLFPGRTRSKGKGSNAGFDDENSLICTNNIMFDSRVVRGNTYASPVITDDQKRNRKAYERNHRARLAREEEAQKKAIPCPGTPPPIDGRVHCDVQTDPYVEVLTSQHVEKNNATQTDFIYDAPAVRPNVDAKEKDVQMAESDKLTEERDNFLEEPGQNR
mmetsp:Transcript_16998/g.34890  ORF Transcript_16998/g.34890 Transcript_16998/m.34890 type:complete len:171 (-) Transcript_16998:73-585(-)